MVNIVVYIVGCHFPLMDETDKDNPVTTDP